VSQFVVTSRPVNRGTADQENWEVEYLPVVLDERRVRAILLGNDPNPRNGDGLRGGSLASRLPKVSAAAIGLAA
jgi:hypothetical protein